MTSGKYTKLFIILPVIFYVMCMIGGFRKIAKATTASYNFTVRLVNGSFFVSNGGTASATTANYNATYQVVNSAGTVIDPGSASTAVATPNGTIRIVNSSGHVVDTLGSSPAPTPSPVPSPTVVQTATIAAGTASTSVTLSSATAGMCVTEAVCGNAQFPATATGWDLIYTGAAQGDGTFLNVYARQVTPQDSTTFNPTTSGNSFESAVAVLTNNGLCSTDGVATAKANASSVNAVSNTWTDTIGNDTRFVSTVMEGASNNVSSAPAGYTCVSIAQNNSNYQGCALCYKTANTAGAVSAQTIVMTGAAASIVGGWSQGSGAIAR